MKALRIYIISGVSMWVGASMLYATESEQTCCPGPRPLRATLQHIEGRGIGYGQGYTSLDLFLGKRLANDAHFSFLDLRGHVFDDGKFAANAGIGYRVLDAKRIWGANAYYDYRNASRLHYNQVGVGLESLGKTWDFRCNGYVPVGKSHSEWKHPKFDSFKGNAIYLHRNQKFALWGIDTEAGAHCDKTKDWDLYGGGGPYYFGNHGKNAWGFKARASATYKQFVYLEASGSYDNIFNTIGQVEVGFSLPFGPRATPKKRACGYDDCGSLAVLEDRLVQPVVRQEIIVEAKRHRKELAIDPTTGQPFNVLFVDNESHSLGTFESPYNTLADAISASVVGDIIYIFPGDGTTAGLDAGPYLLKDNQQILGAATAHPLQTTVGTISITPQAAGMPHLTAPQTSVVVLAHNTTAAGLHVTADGSIIETYCIGVGDSSTPGALKNITVRNNLLEPEGGAYGAFSNSSGVLRFTDNIINIVPFSTGEGTGIYVNYVAGDTGTSLCTVYGNTITSTLPGIYVSGQGIIMVANEGNRTFDIRNNSVSIANTGIEIDSYGGNALTTVAAMIVDNTIIDTASTAISYSMGASSGPSSNNFCVIQNNLMSNNLDSINIATGAGPTAIFEVSGNTIMNASTAVLASASSSDQSVITLNIQDNVIQNMGTAIQMDTDNMVQWTANVISNTFTDTVTAITMNTSGNGSKLTGSVENNTIIDRTISIRNSSTQGLSISTNNSSTGVFTIDSNQFTNCVKSIDLTCGDSSVVCAVVENNTMSLDADQQSFGSIGLTVDVSSSVVTNMQVLSNTFKIEDVAGASITTNNSGSLCLQFQGNQSATDPYLFSKLGSGVFNLVGTAAGNIPIPTVTGTITQVSSCGSCP